MFRGKQPIGEGDIKLAITTIATATLIGITLTTPTATAGNPIDTMSYKQLANAADNAIEHGHVYSHRWGDASGWLKSLCYEMVDRAFKPYGTQAWARYIVNRESGCNPGAINSSSGTTGIAQFDPPSHPWVNYYRLQHDMRYAVWTFLRLSRGGRNTQPWCLC